LQHSLRGGAEVYGRHGLLPGGARHVTGGDIYGFVARLRTSFAPAVAPCREGGLDYFPFEIRSRLRNMKRLLAILLLLAPLHAAGAAPFTPEQEEAIGRILRQYLEAHPEAVLEALEAAEAKAKAEAAETAKRAVATKQRELEADPASPVLGNPKGDVTLVEFFDYRCPYCKQVAPSLAALLDEDRRLRVVMKEFPILGKDSVTAARAALAAERQGKYALFHHALMALKGPLADETVYKTASAAGLDVDRLKGDMASPEIEAQLRANYDLAQTLGIRGTPAFIVGGELIPGAVDLATLRQKIAAARKPG
jgi:protein-disulfide isomerase